ncbi:sigma-70 family RNA polymerase sigma factor [Streptomyces sp. 8K308]|uniref:sigma-70 family RNA polymerase sigma factor n=1 Tax=Streptomyces sp. 8K308 TaxID=2530388 RepID=UPI003264664D
MRHDTLDRARAGDEHAFRELTDPYRREIHLHCYRILGSLADADDMLQETLIAAWRGLGGYAGRASLRSWLYRIATNRCLNALRDAGRRRPPEPAPPFDPPEPTRRGEATWLQPYPDLLLEEIADGTPGPEARYHAKQAAELRSSRHCSTYRHARQPPSCCGTCSATPPARSRPCWRPAPPRSRALCSARVRG